MMIVAKQLKPVPLIPVEKNMDIDLKSEQN
jgi:hypothetical protein